MSVMLDKLLKGQKVEWIKLGDVAKFINGRAYKQPELLNQGKYPVLRVGNFFTNSNWYYSDLELDEDKYADNGDLLYAWSASFGPRIWQSEKVIYHYHIWKVLPNEQKILKKFLYHILEWDTNSLKSEHSNGSTMMHITKGTIEQRLMPIPPLDVQAKIVKILDAFTALTAELTAELIMREKQYHYYRDNLLTFSDDVEWKALNDVVLPTKNIKWKETNLSYRYIDLSSVDRGNNNIGETLEITSKNAPSRAQKIVKQDDIIFATTRPTQMRVAIIPKSFDEQIASTGYCILRANQKEILPKWIYYNLSLDRFKFYLEENQSGVAYPAISDGMVKEFPIPIPSLKEQKRIIEILDKFEILNHSITEGLPKEIALRQKQYEYYREQLLDFPKSN